MPAASQSPLGGGDRAFNAADLAGTHGSGALRRITGERYEPLKRVQGEDIERADSQGRAFALKPGAG